MDGAKEDLVDMFIVHTTEEIQVLRIPMPIFASDFFLKIRVKALPHTIDKFIFDIISTN